MPRGPLGRTVARAARTGGTRSSRGPKQTPLGFYLTLVVVVLAGIAGVGFSRYEVLHPAAASNGSPKIGDHWQLAFGFDICGKVEPNVPKNPGKTTPAIYTTGNGLIQVVPRTSADAGKNATLGRFVRGYPGMVLSATSVGYPGMKPLGKGSLCGKTAGEVEVKVFSSLADTTGSVVRGNPADLHLTNGSLITIAFVPPGTPVGRPRSTSTLALAAAAAASPVTTSPSTPATSRAPTSRAPASRAPTSRATASGAKSSASGATASGAKSSTSGATTAPAQTKSTAPKTSASPATGQPVTTSRP